MHSIITFSGLISEWIILDLWITPIYSIIYLNRFNKTFLFCNSSNFSKGESASLINFFKFIPFTWSNIKRILGINKFYPSYYTSYWIALIPTSKGCFSYILALLTISCKAFVKFVPGNYFIITSHYFYELL
jgi:hypothetical protein